MPSGEWPDWWEWELELSPHLIKRMADRDFTEADLRTMLQDADGWTVTPNPERYLISCRLAGRPWKIVVEPDEVEQLLVVVTAFPT